MKADVANRSRLIFLDNIRYLIVLFVLVLHSSAAYSNVIPWWHVAESSKSFFFDLEIFVLDSFIMPVLFFISGYFALPSLRKRNAGTFIIAKLKRLGIPLISLGLFFAPIMPYIGFRGRAENPVGFLDYWVRQMKTAVDLSFVHVNPADMNMAIEHLDNFSQHHLWFISVLLIFFVIFALGAAAKERLGMTTSSAGTHEETPGARPMLRAMLVAGLIMSFGFALVNLYSQDGYWAKIGGLLLFRPDRMPLFAGMFGLGVYASSRSWFVLHPLPGSVWLWSVAGFVLTSALLVGSRVIYADAASFQLSMAHGLLRAFLCLSYVGLLVSIGHKYWNSPSRIDRNLAASSYDIYLIHMPIVVIFQFIFHSMDLSIFLKFTLVFSLSLLLSLGISRYLIRPRPKLSILLLLIAFAITSMIV